MDNITRILFGLLTISLVVNIYLIRDIKANAAPATIFEPPKSSPSPKPQYNCLCK